MTVGARRSNLALRGPAVAALALAILCGQPENRVGAEAQPNQAAEGKAESPEDPVSPPMRIDLLEQACAEAEESGHDDPDYREKRDLCAQYLSAAAARRTADLAMAQNVIGVVGLVAIVITLIFNIRATNASTTAARAAEISARATHNAERAWLFVQTCNATKVFNAGQPLGFAFKMAWLNSGNTPALDVEIWSHHKLLQPGETFPAVEKKAEASLEDVTPGAIGPKVPFSTGAINRFVSMDDMRKAADDQLRVFLWAHVEYRTVFDVESKRVEKRKSSVGMLVEFMGNSTNLDNSDLPAEFFSYAAVRYDAD